MALRVKAVLVGQFNDLRLYYLIEPFGDLGRDGAIVDKRGSVRLINFVHFVTTTPNIKQFKFSKFHRFLWEPSNEQGELEKWNRIFLRKTQPLDKEMLVGTRIVDELGAEDIKKKDHQERAEYFRRTIAIPDYPKLTGSSIARKDMPIIRSITSLKALGPLLGGKPAIDGDGDGFVDDGLPTMRPFIPGFNLLPDDIAPDGLRSSSRSLRNAPATTPEERASTPTEILAKFDEIAQYVAKRFNNGKPIKTKSDAMAALTSAIPSFGLPTKDKGRSRIAFLDGLNGQKLSEWQIAYINQFLFMIGDDPARNDVIWRLKPVNQDKFGKGTGGYCDKPQGLKGWRPSATFSDEGVRFIPDTVRKPMMTIGYIDEDRQLFNRETLAARMFSPDETNYHVGSFGIHKAMFGEVMAEGPVEAQRMFAATKYRELGRQIDDALPTIFAHASRFANENGIPMSQVGSIRLSQIDDEFASRLLGMYGDSIISIIDGENLSAQQKMRLKQSIGNAFANGTIDDVVNKIGELSSMYNNRLEDDDIATPLKKVEAIIDKWIPVSAKMTGIHESSHAIHNLRQLEKLRQDARILRDEYLERYSRRLVESGQDKPDLDSLKRSLPIEAFYLDVFKKQMSEYGNRDLDSLKSDILHWGISGFAGVLPPFYDYGDKIDSEVFGSMPEMFLMKMQQAVVLKDLVREAIDVLSNPQIANMPQILQNRVRADVVDNIRGLGFTNVKTVDDIFELESLIDGFLSQKLYGPSVNGQAKEILLNDSMARVLNALMDADELIATMLGGPGKKYKDGDALGLRELLMFMRPDILSTEDSSNRNIFRGMKVGDDKSLPNLGIVFRTLGFPDLKIPRFDDSGAKLPSTKIAGFLPDDAKPIIDAMISANALLRNMKGIEGANAETQGREAALLLAFAARSTPDSASLPEPFGGMSISEFMELGAEDTLRLLNESINQSASRVVSAINGQLPQHVNPSDEMAWREQMASLARFFEIIPFAQEELLDLSPTEIDMLAQIASKIGLPARPGSGLKGIPGQAYAPYQGTIVRALTFIGQLKWSLAEFVAESGVADAFGFPFSQVADDGSTRALSNVEIGLLNKLFGKLFAGRLPSDRLIAESQQL